MSLPVGRASATVAAASAVRPRFRGVSHRIAFFLALPLAVALVFDVETAAGRVGAIVFGTSVVAMFGARALYHTVDWPDARRRWLRRLDHAGIYALIAGTYTPVGLLVLSGNWRLVVLGIVWTGAAVAIMLKFLWVDGPKWLSAAFGIGLGWVAVLVFPQIVDRVGIAGSVLVVAGGIAYTAGALVYALRRPDPFPSVFGYHEVFHALVIVAVACQYSAIAFFVLPEH
jgi:hemolysin III